MRKIFVKIYTKVETKKNLKKEKCADIKTCDEDYSC